MLKLLKRKIDSYLLNWKENGDKKPLIIKGAWQIGKTESIRHFGKTYQNFIEINFVTNPEYQQIFDKGFSPESIIKEISFINPNLKFIPKSTLIFFDEIQNCSKAATSLKFFKQNGDYDVICSGSLMGLNYHEIESNSVGYKEDYKMHSMDFEEFLWALGYTPTQIEDLFNHLIANEPFSQVELDVMFEHFRDYAVLGGMPALVNTFVKNKNFSNILKDQRQLLLDYEEDITKYALGLDKGKIKNVYRSIPIFLGLDNKKFQISRIAPGARNRNYVGIVDWLKDAGIVEVCHCLNQVALPLKGNYEFNNYKLYYHDIGLLIASLDDETQQDLRFNKNLNTYKGAIYENLIADTLVKSGYDLYFYKNKASTLEVDFFIRDSKSLIPIEVKATTGTTSSLNRILDGRYPDIKYGIKLAQQNFGFNGKFYTIPSFLAFSLRRFVEEKSSE